MLNLSKKQKSLLTKFLLALGGGAYFVMFSQLNLHFFIRGYAMIIPLQLLALYYVLYLKTKESFSSQDSSN